MLFYLMNKNDIAARFKCVGSNIDEGIEINRNIAQYDIYRKEFLNNRLSPEPAIGRKNIQLLLREAKIYNTEDFLRTSLALSFNDTLWVKEHGSTLTWQDISPYRNSISKVVSEVALKGGYERVDGQKFKTPSPEYQTGGAYSKCWKRMDSSIYIYIYIYIYDKRRRRQIQQFNRKQ